MVIQGIINGKPRAIAVDENGQLLITASIDSLIPLKPAGTLVATDVLAAIIELDAKITANGSFTRDAVNGITKTADDLEVTTPGDGLILTSPNGSRFKLTVDNNGSIGWHLTAVV